MGSSQPWLDDILPLKGVSLRADTYHLSPTLKTQLLPFPSLSALPRLTDTHKAIRGKPE